MLTKTLFPGRYIQGFKAIDQLEQELVNLGRRGFCLLAPSAQKRLHNRLPEKTAYLELVCEEFGRECTELEIARLTAMAQSNKAEFVLTIGGGKTIDTGKVVADRLNIPVAVVPTIASTDAPCSACAILYNEEGEMIGVEYQRRNPALVLVDSEIIAQAPARFLVAGMGDALATWFEAESCRRTESVGEAGGLGSQTAFALARLCYDTLLEHGVAALMSCQVQAVTPALEYIIEANTLLSGLGFESGGLGAAHSIHNGFTVLPQTHAYYHGEKVAMGVLASLFLNGRSRALIDEVYSFCESVGLPTTLADLGLDEVTERELAELADRACAEGECIHNEGKNIVPVMVVHALKAADAEGQRRKNR